MSFDGTFPLDPPLTEEETAMLESMVQGFREAYPNTLIETKWVGRGINVTILHKRTAGAYEKGTGI